MLKLDVVQEKYVSLFIAHDGLVLLIELSKLVHFIVRETYAKGSN